MLDGRGVRLVTPKGRVCECVCACVCVWPGESSSRSGAGRARALALEERCLCRHGNQHSFQEPKVMTASRAKAHTEKTSNSREKDRSEERERGREGKYHNQFYATLYATVQENSLSISEWTRCIP